MSWFGSASEWKQGLGSLALSKVEELENQVERFKRERQQKQNQLDTLQQALDKQKLKTDDTAKEKQSLLKDIEQLSRSCEQLQLQLQKSQHDHVTSSITLLPPRQTAAVESLPSHSGEEVNSLRKKVDELMQENRSLQIQLGEQKTQAQSLDSSLTSSTSSLGDDDRDFWGSERGNKWSQRTPSTTPRKALETSEENPFKTPFTGPHIKALGMSEGNPIKSQSKLHSLSSLSTSSLTPNDDYIKELERAVEQYKMELEGLKSSSSALPDTSKLQQEVTTLRATLDKANADLSTREKNIKAANEQLSMLKSNEEAAAGKLVKTEQRLRAIQSELECQRHNSEAARKNQEDKFKERERELSADITRAQNDMMGMERQICDLQTKLQQQETLSRNTQNTLQASLDKALAQIASVDKDCKVAVNRSSQLEAEIAKLEKTAQDSAKTLTQLRQDKEMAAAQVLGLKTKLCAAESLVEKLTTRVELAEQLADSRKLELEQLHSDKDKAVKEAENTITKLSQEIIQLQEELKSKEKQKEEAQQAINITKDECDKKLAGINSMEAEVTDMRGQVSKITADMECLKCETAASIKTAKEEASLQVEKIQAAAKLEIDEAKMNAEAEIAKIKEATELEVKNAKKTAAESIDLRHEETQAQLNQMRQQVIEAETRVKVAEEEKLEAQNKEDAARGERLAAEVSKWELEGKNDTLKADIAQHLETINSLKYEIEVLMREKAAEEHHESQMREKEASVQMLTSSLEEKKQTISDLEKKCFNLEVKLETLSEDKEQIESQLKDERKLHTDSIATLNKSVEEKELTLAKNYKEMDALTVTLASAQAENMELVDQLKSLKGEMEDKFQNLQVSLVDSVTALEKERDFAIHLQSRCDSHEQQLKEAREQKQQIEVKYVNEEKHHTESIRNLNSILEKHEESLEKKQKEMENLKSQLETMKAENRILEEERERMITDNEEKLSIVQGALEVAETQSANLKEQGHTLHAKLDQLSITFENKAQTFVQERSELGQAIACLKLSLEDLGNKHREKSTKLTEAEQDICQLTVSIDEKTMAYNEVVSTLRSNESLIKEREIEIAKLEKLVEEATDNWRDSKCQCEILTCSLKEKEEELSQSSSTSRVLSEEFDALKSRLEAAALEISALKDDIVLKSQKMSELEINAKRTEEAMARVEYLEEELKKLHEKHDVVVAQLSEASVTLVTKEEECTQSRAAIEELENKKNATIQSLQDKQSLLSEEKKTLLARLQEEEKKTSNASQNQLEVKRQLDGTWAQSDEFQKELEEHKSAVCKLKETHSRLLAEKLQWEEEQKLLKSTVENLQQAKNNLSSKVETLHNSNACLRDNIETLRETSVALKSKYEEMVSSHKQLESSLTEKSEELEHLRVSHKMLQEMGQHTAETEYEELVVKHTKLAQDYGAVKSELDKVKEELDSAMRALQTAKKTMVDIETFHEVCKEKEFISAELENIHTEYLQIYNEQTNLQELLRITEDRAKTNETERRKYEQNFLEMTEVLNARITTLTDTVTSFNNKFKEQHDSFSALRKNFSYLEETLDEITSKFEEERKKGEMVQKDFDNYREIITMMGHQQNCSENNEVAEIRRENADLIARFVQVEKANKALHLTVCRLRKKEAELTLQLEAASLTGDTVSASQTSSHAESVEDHDVMLQEPSNMDSDTSETVSVQLRAAEATIVSLQHQLNTTSKELESLRESNHNMQSEECDKRISDVSTEESDIIALKREILDLKNEVAAKERLIQEMGGNTETLGLEIDNLETGNYSNVTQPQECYVETSPRKSSKVEEPEDEGGDMSIGKTCFGVLKDDRKALKEELQYIKKELMVSQEQLKSNKSLKDQLKNELDEVREKLNQTLYDLERTKNQNKFNRTIAEELEEKVSLLETELKAAIDRSKQLQEENKKLTFSSNSSQDESFPERQTDLSSSIITRLQEERNNLQEKYNCLKEQLGKMFEKQENFNMEFEESNNKSEELAFLNEELSSKNDELASKNDLLISKNEELTVMLDELKNEVTELMGQNNVLKSNTETLNKKEEELLKENEDLLALKQDLDTQIQTTSQKLEEVMSGNKTLISRNTDIVLQNEMLIAENQHLKTSLATNSEDLKELEQLKKNIQILEKELELKVHQIDTRCTELATQVEVLKAEKEELVSSYGVVSSEKKELLTASQELTVNYNAIVAQSDQILKENLELCSEKERLQSEMNAILKDKIELLSEKEKLQSQLKHLEKERDQLCMEKEALLTQKDELKLERDLALNDEVEISKQKSLEAKIKEFEKENDELISEKETLVKQNEDLLSEKSVMLNEKMLLLSEKKELQAEKEMIVKENNKLLSDKEALQMEKQELLEQKNIILSDKQQLSSTNAQLHSENAKILKEKEVMLSEREILVREKDEILKNVEDMASEKNIMILEQQKLEGEMMSMRGENEQIKINMGKLKIKVEENELDIEGLHATIKNLISLKESLVLEKDQLNKINEQQIQKMEKLTTELSTLQDQITNNSSQNENLLSQLTQHVADKQLMNSEIEHLKSKAEDWLIKKDQLTEISEQQQEEIDKLTSDISALQSQITNLSSQNETLSSRCAQHNTDKKLIDSEIEQLKSNIKDLLTEKDHFLKINKQQCEEMEKLTRERTELQEERKNIFSLNETLSSQITQHDTEKKLLHDKIDLLKSNMKGLTEEKDKFAQDLEDARTCCKSFEDDNETQRKTLESQKIEIESLQNVIGSLKQQQLKQDEAIETLKKSLTLKVEEVVEVSKELARVKEELHVVQGDLQVSRENLSNKLKEATNLMMEKASMEVEMASLKDKISSVTEMEKCLITKEAEIEELSNLVKESRTDLATLRAKFSLNQKISRKKEEELREYMKHIDDMKEEANQLKQQVNIAEERSTSHHKQLEKVTQQVAHWQNRFNKKNTEAEEEASKHIEIINKMLDLEERNESLESKVVILQAQIKKLKSNNSKEISQTETGRQKRNSNVISDASSSHIKEATGIQPSQGSDSQEIVGSSQTPVAKNSSSYQITRRAVTRRATMLSLLNSSASSSPKASSSSPQEGRTRLRRSRGGNLDGTSSIKLSHENKMRMRRSHSDLLSGTAPLDNETMKQAMKRVSASTSSLKCQKKRRSGTDKPGLPGFAETLSTKLKKGLNDLPSDLESPGVVQRSTTLAKKMRAGEKLQEGGPLKYLNPNSPIHVSSRRSHSHRSSNVVTRSKAPCSAAHGEECKTQ
ncbi:centromere protein F isoform X3 [Cherax quadricarinatus]|uniref:centromere protein F isoform X3 n=1 Tax=Cherax quadricarinatus TaxID=27406 RepID=UPI00387EC4B3